MIGLSKSSLDTFKSCPKCFWLEKIKKLKRVDGIKASIMAGIDDCMKRVSDHSAQTGGPLAYLAEFPGARPHHDRPLVQRCSSWRTFQATVKIWGHTALIWGQVDDIIEWENGSVSPFDFKSNGKERDWIEYTKTYNLLQADMYDILLAAQGMTVTGDAYFTYQWPIVENGVMGWQFKTVTVKTNPARALETIAAACDCLNGPEPESDPSCEYCSYVAKRSYSPKAK